MRARSQKDQAGKISVTGGLLRRKFQSKDAFKLSTESLPLPDAGDVGRRMFDSIGNHILIESGNGGTK